MVLVDTSIWVHHFRNSLPSLQALLLENAVVCHPFLIGEIACGQLKHRSEILRLMSALPQAKELQHDEVLYFIEQHRLIGLGASFIDMHLLASAVLTHVPLWTLDKVLATASEKLQVHYK